MFERTQSSSFIFGQFPVARKLIINGGAIRQTGLLLSPGVGSLVGQPQITNGPPSYIYGAPMVVLQRWANRGSADTPTVGQQRTYRWCTVGPTEAYRLATLAQQLIVGPTVGQQRPTGGYSHRWANRGSLDTPTVGHRWLPPLAHQYTYRWPPLGQRWLATGGPTEAHRWLATVGPTVGQQRPTGGYSHRWANRGSLDTPTVGHRWLPPLAHQYTYRWPTVGPPE